MIVLVGAGIGLCIILIAVLLTQHLRKRDIADCTMNLASYAMMLSAHLESSFTVLEAVQDGVLDQLRGEDIKTEERFVSLVATAAMHELLTMRVGAIRYVGAITLLDRHGKLLNSSYYWPVPYRDLSDREYFHALSAEHGPDRFVSTPLQNRATGVWTVYVARRVSAPNGEFLGILLGEINFSYFQSFFAEVMPKPDAVVSMFHLNGVMLVRQPPVPGVIGTAPRTGAFQLLTNGHDRGTIRTVSPVDGKDRLVAIHRLPHYPLVVSLSRTMEAVLQPWQEQQRYIVTTAMVLEAGLAVIMLLGVRHLRGRNQVAKLQASLLRADMDRALAAESARFTVAVNAMTQGLCQFDKDHRLIVSNPRFAEMFGLLAATLARRATFGTIVRRAISNRLVSAADIRRLTQILSSTAEASSTALWDLCDGRSLSVSLDRMLDQGWLMTFTDVTERRRTDAQIAHMARHDSLTGLANRRHFHERLTTAAGLAARGTPHAVLYLDLDHFKGVNDTLGHPVGDALLQAVTERLRRCCREVDIIARLGGDEFAIILPMVQHALEANALAERIIGELGLPFDLLDHRVVIGCSIGIAFTPQDGADADVLLRCADLALYKAKADGRNCCRFFEPGMDAALEKRRALEAALRHDLERKMFRLSYQPLIATQSGTVSTFEALLRWDHPDHPTVGPGEFIPIAEETGLIIPLGQWVLETACREAMNWPKDIAVAVNISPIQFRSRHFVGMVRDVLEETGLPGYRLELEITEGLLLHDVTETVSTLHQLKALGIRISMDDFGTGYSSLSYLLKFPFDKVKLDRSFMADLGNGGQRDVIVQAITTMCLALGMQTTGEGVETASQLRFLRDHHCTEVQGFLFSPPVPEAEIPSLLATLGYRHAAALTHRSDA